MANGIDIGGVEFEFPDFFRDVNRPVYLANREGMEEAHRHLFYDNPPGPDGRNERMIIVGGPVQGNVRKLSVMRYPKAEHQNIVSVGLGSKAIAQALIYLDKKGHGFHGTIHNHPGMGVRAACPSIVDMENHRNLERIYTDYFTMIGTDDGAFTFWKPVANYDLVIYDNGRFVDAGFEHIGGRVGILHYYNL